MYLYCKLNVCSIWQNCRILVFCINICTCEHSLLRIGRAGLNFKCFYRLQCRRGLAIIWWWVRQWEAADQEAQDDSSKFSVHGQQWAISQSAKNIPGEKLRPSTVPLQLGPGVPLPWSMEASSCHHISQQDIGYADTCFYKFLTPL